MNDFAEQCRREWRRLGVPDELADEMAQDLASDLEEAAAEGLTLEQYLGTGASDARSFAASWAAERGVGAAQQAPGVAARRPRFLLPFTVFMLVVLVVTALLLATGQPKLSLIRSRTTSTGITSSQVLHATSAAAPVEWILLVVALAALAFATWTWLSWRRARATALA